MLVVMANESKPEMAQPVTVSAVQITTWLEGFSPFQKYATITVERMPARRWAKNTGMVEYLKP